MRKQARARVEGVEIDDLADRVEDATSAEGDEKPLQHVNIFEDAEQGVWRKDLKRAELI